ncbi:unnamed protein product [Adineta ricciae]|uniref:G-protein coupled receptors family 1 profile domain-containing protein n=1 Tax=Adineta ricciae TaxID=249248 RepID=A0A814P922_ADIRI|nr:unnamed protein product [Adineta ricciae]
MSLVYIGQQITIYYEFFLLIFGFIGNFLTILILSTTRIYRTNPSTFYMLIASIHNLFQMIPNLLLRILSVSFELDYSRTSHFWCKSRITFAAIFGFISLSCACLSTIDQYLITSRKVSFRHKSQIKWSHRIVLIIMIIVLLHSIPSFISYDISSINHICTYTNLIFAVYVPVSSFLYLCIIPISILITFGCLTYRNLQQIRNLNDYRFDRQLTKTILMQVILIIISQTPYAIYNAYMLIGIGRNKDAKQLEIENFAFTITGLMAYEYFSVRVS